MTLGQVIEVAECRHCLKKIDLLYWGNGGNMWVHRLSGSVLCQTVPHATPIPKTITEVR